MYNSFARACPHVGHREGCGGTGGNSLDWDEKGARGADLGQETREEKKNPAVPAKQGSEMKYRPKRCGANALCRLFYSTDLGKLPFLG